jgi:hypothetical protein
LVAGDEAAFRIDGEGDPGAFLVLGHVVEFFHLEALRHGDVRCGDGFGGAAVFAAATFAIEGQAPGAFAIVVDLSRWFPSSLPVAVASQEPLVSTSMFSVPLASLTVRRAISAAMPPLLWR